ncbi:hypothetical protein V6N13_117124 [Hibiscus sabdariffa]|uniref:Uncharacterized protein n=1 Tax=Hibiscus sabdariffa TaxID=183260 RepID=A0ABR2QHB5_9ROSI
MGMVFYMDHQQDPGDERIHGDRSGYDDPAIVTGIGTIDGSSLELKNMIELLKLEIARAGNKPDTESKSKIEALQKQIRSYHLFRIEREASRVEDRNL